MMTTTERKLLNALKTIEGNGSFVTSAVKNFVPLGLNIKGLGEIGLPAISSQIKDMIQLARQAPFGKGSETVTDTNVRSAWEIDASELSFHNKEWGDYFENILDKVKEKLGLEDAKMTASLYKLLIYKKGGFFLPHKDSEKEPGMFGTLVVGLPSKHTGGELLVRFDGKEEEIDFSVAASDYKIPYAAFFADCEHEIKPVTSGHRLCLVYNLVQIGGKKKLGGSQYSTQTSQIASLLETWAKDIQHYPKAILLGHQYTPSNFSSDTLKLHDRPRAEALLAAAEQAGYFAKLGLVTSYIMGDLEDDDYSYGRRGRRSRYYDYDEEETPGTMGDEIYEDYVQIEHWVADGLPDFGKVTIDETYILSEIELREDDPIQQQQEGFTGNEGMTIEYWYHYGAVILWPKNKHAEMLKSTSNEVQLQWLNFYLQHWEDENLQASTRVKEIIIGLKDISAPVARYGYKMPDFNPITPVLIQLNDSDFIKEHCGDSLTKIFDKINVDNWTNLIEAFPSNVFSSIFQRVGSKSEIGTLYHLLTILKNLLKKDITAFVLYQIQQLPIYLMAANLHELKSSIYSWNEDKIQQDKITLIVEHTLQFSSHVEEDKEWMKNIRRALSKSLPRPYVNDVLVPALLKNVNIDNNLTQELAKICVSDLKNRTIEKPMPLPDWTREVPETGSYYASIWKLLTPFLKSPTEQVFDYKKKKSDRNNMVAAISNVTIDLKMETLTHSRTHTLRLTKTQAAYKKDLSRWEEDMALLKQLE